MSIRKRSNINDLITQEELNSYKEAVFKVERGGVRVDKHPHRISLSDDIKELVRKVREGIMPIESIIDYDTRSRVKDQLNKSAKNLSLFPEDEPEDKDLRNKEKKNIPNRDNSDNYDFMKDLNKHLDDSEYDDEWDRNGRYYKKESAKEEEDQSKKPDKKNKIPTNAEEIKVKDIKSVKPKFDKNSSLTFDSIIKSAAPTDPFTGNVDKTMNETELVRALRLDIIGEQDAVNLYGSHADATTNEEVKKTLLDIADEEKVHIGELEGLLAKLTDDEDKRDEGEEEQEDAIPGDYKEEDSDDEEDKLEKEALTYESLIKQATDFPGNFVGDGNPTSGAAYTSEDMDDSPTGSEEISGLRDVHTHDIGGEHDEVAPKKTYYQKLQETLKRRGTE